MLREIVKIDEELCDGCGQCIPGCHEGALQMIDGKARLISDLMCDGLGACLGHCPQGAISIEKREAQAYDERAVMQEMVSKGLNTVVAHLKHLKEHEEYAFLKQGIAYLSEYESSLSFDLDDVMKSLQSKQVQRACPSGGCPGSNAQSFQAPSVLRTSEQELSALTHWPIQLHLINPNSTHFQASDLLVAADCSAFAMGGFHQRFLQGKTLVIACPKLDQGTEIYKEKIQALIDESRLNTITVVIMKVPCCGGLLELVRRAVEQAERKVSVRALILGLQGQIEKEMYFD